MYLTYIPIIEDTKVLVNVLYLHSLFVSQHAPTVHARITFNYSMFMNNARWDDLQNLDAFQFAGIAAAFAR